MVDEGIVQNVIVLEDDSEWAPPDGQTIVPLEDDSPVGINWRQAARGEWVQPEVEETPADPLDDLKDKTGDLTEAERTRVLDEIIGERLREGTRGT